MKGYYRVSYRGACVVRSHEAPRARTVPLEAQIHVWTYSYQARIERPNALAKARRTVAQLAHLGYRGIQLDECVPSDGVGLVVI